MTTATAKERGQREQELRSRSTICHQDGCDRRTFHGKPYCSEHVLQMPYAQSILERIERRDHQVRMLTSGYPSRAGAGPLEEEARAYAPCTAARMRRRLHLEGIHTRTIAKWLRSCGWDTSRRTRRGSIVLDYSPDHQQQAEAPGPDSEDTARKQEILIVLYRHPEGLAPREIGQRMERVPTPDVLSNTLRDMLRADLVEAEGKGKNRRYYAAQVVPA